MQDEQMIAIVSFEGAVKREVKRVREGLKPAAEAGIVSSNEFTITVKATGRILDGEIKLIYGLSCDYYNGNLVEGNSLSEVLQEVLRRKGWQKVNEPISISFDKVKEIEIPF